MLIAIKSALLSRLIYLFVSAIKELHTPQRCIVIVIQNNLFYFFSNWLEFQLVFRFQLTLSLYKDKVKFSTLRSIENSNEKVIVSRLCWVFQILFVLNFAVNGRQSFRLFNIFSCINNCFYLLNQVYFYLLICLIVICKS